MSKHNPFRGVGCLCILVFIVAGVFALEKHISFKITTEDLSNSVSASATTATPIPIATAKPIPIATATPHMPKAVRFIISQDNISLEELAEETGSSAEEIIALNGNISPGQHVFWVVNPAYRLWAEENHTSVTLP